MLSQLQHFQHLAHYRRHRRHFFIAAADNDDAKIHL